MKKKKKQKNKLKNRSEISTLELVQMRSLLCRFGVFRWEKGELLAPSWFIPNFMSAPSFLDYNKFVVAQV